MIIPESFKCVKYQRNKYTSIDMDIRLQTFIKLAVAQSIYYMILFINGY
jgi:hypothetical protein